MALENISRLTQFYDSKASIEALSGSLDELRISYATDTNELGFYVNGAWIWISTGPTGGLGWFNVKDYGALGDGSTNDTAAISSAISAMTTSGGGVLYFPHGNYITTGGFSISVNCVIFGDGGYWAETTIRCTSATANLFAVAAASLQVNFQDLYLLNTATTPTAGAAISVGSANGPQVNATRVVIELFYDNAVVVSGSNWVWDNCWIGTCRRYGLYIRNTFNGDQGDWGLVNCVFTAHTYNPTAAIRIESSGGGRIVNCKINSSSTGWAYGIDLAVALTTSILLIGNNSIENVRTYGIHLTNTATKTYSQIIIDGNQFGMYQNSTNPAILAAASASGDLRDLVITSNTFLSTSSPTYAISLTNIVNGFVGGNVTDGYTNLLSTTTCTNIVQAGTVTSVATGTGLTGGPIIGTGTISLANTTVTPGSYTYMSATVDAQGRLTAASSGTTPVTTIYGPLVNGDLPGPTPIATDDGQFIMTPVS